MSDTPIQPAPEDTTDPVITETPAPEPAPASAHPDPITGEPGAHPVGVGVGALGAGVAGAAIGAIGGPVGILIGAAIGAVAGGLAGKEVAAGSDAPVVESGDVITEEPLLTISAGLPTPISMGSLPGEGLHAMGAGGFAGGASALATGALATPQDDALPTPTHAAVAEELGFQAPVVPEATPLAGDEMPHSGEETIRVSAYYHYLGRTETGEPGDALGDWLTAESEMMLG